MDFIDEQDVAILQIGKQRRKVTRLGDNRAGRRAKTNAHFLGNDLSECSLSKPRRPKKQDMVKRLPTPLGSLNKYAKIITRSGLPDKLGKRFRA